MAIKIPLAQEQVDIRDTSGGVPTPQSTAPQSSAFGANVAEAQGQIGQQVQHAGDVLGQHMIERAQLASTANAYKNSQGFRTGQIDILASTDLENWKDSNGNDRTRMRGLLNQKGEEAEGGYLRYNAAMDNLDKQWSGPLSNNGYALNIYRNQVAAHRETGGLETLRNEGKQKRIAESGVFLGTANSIKEDGKNASSGEEVNNAIHGTDGKDGDRSLVGAVTMYGLAIDHPEFTVTQLSKDIGDLSSNFADNYLKTPNPVDGKLHTVDQTMAEVNKINGLSVDQKQNIRDKIEKGYVSMASQRKLVDENTKTINGIALVQLLATKKGSWQLMGDVSAMDIPQELKDAVIAASNDAAKPPKDPGTHKEGGGWFGFGAKDVSNPPIPGKYDQGVNAGLLSSDFARKPELKRFAFAVSDILKQTDQQSMLKSLATAMQDKGISSDKLAILSKLLLQRAKSLPEVAHTLDVNGGAQRTEGSIPPVLADQDAGLQSLMSWQHANGVNDPNGVDAYYAAIKKGATTKEAFDSAARSSLVLKYPEIGGVLGTPNMVMGANSKLKFVFPGTNSAESDYIWQNGKMELNPKRKSSANSSK